MVDILDKKREIKSKNMQQLYEYRCQLQKNPKLVYLFIELTDQCNLHCWHCGSNCGNSKHTFLDTAVLKKALYTVAKDFLPNQMMICLTGGEPLLHPDFYQIVKIINSLGFRWGMTTNATLIDKDVAEALKEHSLSSITVSLDGLEAMHDALRGEKGAFTKTCQAIKHLNDTGIPVQVTSVIHHENITQLETMYTLMCSLKVISWRVINLEPIGRALQKTERLLDSEQMRELLDFIREKRFSKDTPMDVRFGCSHYLSYDYEREVRDNYFFCGSGLYVGSILCNGDIYSCLDIERRPELVQGNILNDRFSDVWYHKFKEFRKDRSLENERCSQCLERNFCMADSGHTWDYEKKEPRFCMMRDLNNS